MPTRKNILKVLGMAWAILLTGQCQMVGADTLYATNRLKNRFAGDYRASTLHLIDPHTGDVSVVGSIGYPVVDIAWDRTRGKLYGVVEPDRSLSDSDSFRGLIIIDTITGKGTPVSKWRDLSGSPLGDSYKPSQIDIDSKGGMYVRSRESLDQIAPFTGMIISSAKFFVDFNPDGEEPNLFSVDIGGQGFSFDSKDILWRNLEMNNGSSPFNAIYTNLTTGISPSVILAGDNNRFQFSGGIELDGDVGRHGTFDLSSA